MIYKRAVARLRAQDWLAITIELVIVIVGVFLGTWVAGWANNRAERAETAHRLAQLRPELRRIEARATLVNAYFATARQYAQTAFAGWANHPAVSDSGFVIAAYQASQIDTMASTSQIWAELFGADQLRNIDDPAIREPMLRLMTFPAENIGLARVQTRYREHVRSVIPDEIQQRIRSGCGDYLATPNALDYSLRARCPLTLEPRQAALVAASLRRAPELVGELRLHQAMVASFLTDVEIYHAAAKRLGRALQP